MGKLRAGRPFAVLDLGTGYVKTLLIHRGPTGGWSVVGAGTVSYRRPRGATGKLIVSQLDAAEEALERAGSRALRLAGREVRPATCIVAIPSPPAETLLFRHEAARSPEAGPISRREALEIAAAAGSAATEAGQQSYSKRHRAGTPTWLGSNSRAASVDGRPVSSLEGMRGQVAAVELGVAAAGRSARRLVSWCDEQGMEPLLVSEPLWRARMLDRWTGHAVLDLGARRTHLAYRDARGSFRDLSVAVGGYHFTRYLSLAAGVSPSRAERLKIAYAAGRLDEPSQKQTRRLMQRALTSWLSRLTEALAQLHEVVPGRWLCCGGGASLPEMALLPGLIAGDSISRLDRYPVHQPLAPADLCRYLSPGPERIGPAHLVALALADWWLQLQRDPAARGQAVSLAESARLAGYEVDAGWLKL